MQCALVEQAERELAAAKGAVDAAGGASAATGIEGTGCDAASPSLKVIADHIRACAFTITDGVIPGNEGRGYVLRRILRRAVRHAWLLGRKEPTLTHVCETVIATMGDAFPELRQRAKHIVETTRIEEQSFLQTIEGGLSRFDQIAPVRSTQGGPDIRGTVSGEDAFKLYDTFGFPIDLTELMARERGYTIDIAGFNRWLDMQRKRSQDERKSRKLAMGGGGELGDLAQWDRAPEAAVDVQFVGYDRIAIQTEVTALRRLGGDRVAVLLRETPFYAESGGQVSDLGEIVGDGWRVDVEDVRKVEGRPAAVGTLEGDFAWGTVTASVPGTRPITLYPTNGSRRTSMVAVSRLPLSLGLALFQFGSAFAMYGLLRRGHIPRWIGTAHVWAGRLAVLAPARAMDCPTVAVNPAVAAPRHTMALLPMSRPWA